MFPINGNPGFSKDPKNLHKKPADSPVLFNWVFGNFISAKELFQKALRSFETCVLVSNSLCEKSFSYLEPPTTFDEIFRITSVPFFIPDFILLSC